MPIIHILAVISLRGARLSHPHKGIHSGGRNRPETGLFAAAKKQGKPVFLYWGEEWCPFCNQLEETVFVRDKFINLSHEFIALKLGTDSEQKIQYGDRFDIRGFPTVIVFSADGRTLTRIDGGNNTEQYARVLETTLGEVRPVGELVRSVQAGEQLSNGEWTLLANYPWRHEADRVLADDADLHSVFQILSDRVHVALEDPEASALERIAMLMGWVSVSTATAQRVETLPEEKIAWVAQQAEAARGDLPPSPLQAGLFFLYGVYSRIGVDDDARDVLRQGIEEAQAPYYFMTILASLEKRQDNIEEALEWYRKAWDASRGPVNRIRWGSEYLSNLLELSPDNLTAIRETGLQILTDIADQDDWQQNFERTLSRMSDQLLN